MRSPTPRACWIRATDLLAVALLLAGAGWTPGQSTDPSVKLEFIAPLAVAGHPTEPNPLLSYDGRHVACATHDDSGQFVISHDGTKHGPLLDYAPETLVLSANGASVGWLCRTFDGYRAFLNGESVGEPARSIASFTLSPDGQHTAFVATLADGSQGVIFDGEVVEKIRPPDTTSAAPGGRRRRASRADARHIVAFEGATQVLTHDSEEKAPFVWCGNSNAVAFATEAAGGATVIVVSSGGSSFTVPVEGYSVQDDWHRTVLSVDGRRVAFARRSPQSGECEVVLASAEGVQVFAAPEPVRALVFGPDDISIWYVCGVRQAGSAFVGGDLTLENVSLASTGDPYPPFHSSFLTFDAQQRPVTVQESSTAGSQMLAVRVGNERHEPMSALSRLSFRLDPTRRRIAYWGRPSQVAKGGAWFVDGKPGPLQPSVRSNWFLFSPDGEHYLCNAPGGTCQDGTVREGLWIDTVPDLKAWFAPDGQYVYASGTLDRTGQDRQRGIIKLDLATGEGEVIAAVDLQAFAPQILGQGSSLLRTFFPPGSSRPLFLIAYGSWMNLAQEREDDDGRTTVVNLLEGIPLTGLLQEGLSRIDTNSSRPMGARIRRAPEDSCWWDEEGRLTLLGRRAGSGEVHVARVSLPGETHGVPISRYDDLEAVTWTGNVVRLRDLRGKVVYLQFWASDGPTRIELPGLVSAYKKHHDEGLEILGFGLDSEEQAQATCKGLGIPWPQVRDAAAWAAKYHVKGTPSGVLLGRDGYVRYDLHQPLRRESLYRAIEEALQE